MAIYRCAFAVLLAGLFSCDSRPDWRPGNLTGSVGCKIVDTLSSTLLTVRVILDSVAASVPARMEILPLRADPVSPGSFPNRLVAGFGGADGSIHECGGVSASVIQISVTGQMASYPTWARAYSSAPVTWLVVDLQGRQLADSMVLAPGGPKVTLAWNERTRGKPAA